jgi:hypothetical protein
MEWMIWTGAVISLLGVLGLIWCIVAAARARRAGLDKQAMAARLQRLVAMNMGALALSGIGLGMVVVGILLS